MPHTPRTIIDKIWDAHIVTELGPETSLLHVDRIMLHERMGAVALAHLAATGRRVVHPEMVFATLDHIIDTDPGRGDATHFPGGRDFIETLRRETQRHGIRLFDLDDPAQGISHVIGPELGLALPGATMVCGDSHTCSLGGIGALAWGIGASEGEHALATQTLRQKRAKRMRVTVSGRLPDGSTAKDLILSLIRRYGAAGGRGHAVEFAGPAIRALPVAARLTLCNMAVEFGAWTGIVAPDDIVFDYLQGRLYAPQGPDWEMALAQWRGLATDPDAVFDQEITLDGDAIVPHVTWGTSPQHAVAIDERVPDPTGLADPAARQAALRALDYMDLRPGTALEAIEIDAAFIGSCTNSRIEDLRAAAQVLEGRRVRDGIKAICVPGSSAVKRAAEAEGLDRIFRDAGFEWRESGCSLCFWVGGDNFGAARRIVSSTNRNFENRQGPGVRTHLASPATVAASAVTGHLTDIRRLEAC